MIKSFQHKGLKVFFTTGNKKGIASFPVERIRRILDAVDGAESATHLKIPGFDTHELGGRRKGTWAITVTGNWRITLKFDGRNAVDVDLEDYH